MDTRRSEHHHIEFKSRSDHWFLSFEKRNFGCFLLLPLSFWITQGVEIDASSCSAFVVVFQGISFLVFTLLQDVSFLFPKGMTASKKSPDFFFLSFTHFSSLIRSVLRIERVLLCCITSSLFLTGEHVMMSCVSSSHALYSFLALLCTSSIFLCFLFTLLVSATKRETWHCHLHH